MLLLSSAETFSKKNSGTLSGRQMFWIQIRNNVLSVLIRWAQTFEMAKVASGKVRVKYIASPQDSDTLLLIKVDKNVPGIDLY